METTSDVTGSSMSHRGTSTQEEGIVTRKIEEQTQRLPSGTFLTIAIASMAASAGLALLQKRKDWANFVGLWVPTLLMFGIYNKIVKAEHSQKDFLGGYTH